MDNKCLTNKIVYKAEVKTNDRINKLSTEVYFGISETEVKSRYNNHAMSFRNQTHENDTKLSKYIWSLKDEIRTLIVRGPFSKNLLDIIGIDIVFYGIVLYVLYGIVSKWRNLCLLEKLIVCKFKDKDRLLNKRLDLVLKCRHGNKYILMNYSGIH